MNHIEAVRRVAAVRGRVGEGADEVVELEDAAGPAVHEEQRLQRGVRAQWRSSAECYTFSTDSWTAMSTTNQPTLRTQATAVWTGKKLVVWGGISGLNFVGNGGMYDSATDMWEAVN